MSFIYILYRLLFLSKKMLAAGKWGKRPAASKKVYVMKDLSTEEKIAHALEHIPFAKELGIRPMLMGDELTLILPYAPHIIGNPMLQALHGGAVGAFLETTAIVQLWLLAQAAPEPQPLPKTIGISLDYLRRGHPKDTFARAEIGKQGSRVSNVRARAWQDKYDEPISVLHGHFLLPSPKKTDVKPAGETSKSDPK